jgi:hypothetical protein
VSPRRLLATLLVATLAVLPRPSAAAGIVRSEVDSRRVGALDQVQLTLTVEGSSLPDQIAMPALVNLRVLGGPSVSTQMSFVNGQSSQSRSWTWLLQPIKPGHAEVGAVQVQGVGCGPRDPDRRRRRPSRAAAATAATTLVRSVRGHAASSGRRCRNRGCSSRRSRAARRCSSASRSC